ncbi:FtsK/SpoIIIE domain-containing protein [uncultured Prevotella sp.]|uniref:FtsK/SpoIIIE domain-containing protein n=1 Tax=uncultured Prevotella sp. TaxID=159272 RepID=UPI002604C90C|nr:FtsK/SpoIIIE domain-containing protein [uncultured Prevotella sp.]
MAKTIAAIDMLVKYLEHRIRNIKADTKEAYDIERGEIVDELKQLAERISNIDPIILPRLPKADLQDEVIRNIASAASKRTTMPPIYTDTTCNIGIQNIAVCLPKYVNFSETPGATIYGINGWEEFAQKKMTHLLMSVLLSMPLGKVRLHFIDLNFSCKAQFFIDNFDPSVCNIYCDVQSAKGLAESLKTKMAQRLRGELSDNIYDFVVFLDFLNDYNNIGNAYRQIIEKGAFANIHTVFILNDYNVEEGVYDPGLLDEDKFCFINGYTTLKDEINYTEAILSLANLSLAQDSDFRSKCIEYLNNGLQTEDEPEIDEPEIDKTEYAVTTSAIEAPIGKTTDGETVDFKIDVNRGHYHAFVIGETGSGKSRFLHDIIINMIVKYSPEDVELYLMDFKGVEFNPYRDIKHSRVILVDRADERITYEVIHELKQKMEERQKILAAAGASDVDEYNKMSADSHISQIILVADECQTLFSDDAKNNKLQRDMIATIALIAQQGRAYGVHLLLATQSLSNAPQLGASILNQIGEHYILPCLPADAQKLVPDHERKDTETVVSQMEKGKGQCYYQGADGKFLFTFSYIPKGEVQDSLIEAAKKKSDGHNSNGQVYFSGSLQYAMDEQTIDVIAAKGRRHIVASPGQSIAIPQSPVTIPLRDESGENIMLLGINDKQYVTRTSINTLVSMIATNRRKELDYEFVVMDCMKCDDDEPYMDILDKLQAEGLCRLVRPRDRKALLYQLCKDIASGSARPTMLTILGEETFRELKFDEPLEFAEDNNSNPTKDEAQMSYDDALAMMNMLGNPVTSKPQTDSGISDIKTMMQALEYILDHGPENGVHTIMQLDRIGNFYITKDGYVNSKAVYSRFAHLLILRSGENDVAALSLPDDIRPAVLEDNGERLRAYYYNEGSNRYELFTPYLMSKTELIDKLLK